MRTDAGEIARALAPHAAAIARDLLPHGRREGAEWVAPSLAGVSPRSLSVRLTGSKAGVWADFAGDARGDLLDLVATVQCGGDKSAALRWARGFLGLGPASASPARPGPPPVAAPPADDAEAEGRRRAALRLFLDAQATLRDTPAAAYLAARGIDLAELARQPRALRFHPAASCREAAGTLPAMLAAITDATGRHVATHRTYLARDAAGAWRKAELHAPKMVLGTYAGGMIRLWRGASGRPLAQIRETEPLVIAEGIETALSIALACPELRVLAAVSVSNLSRIVLPPAAIDVIIAADNDDGNAAAEGALQRAVDRLLAEGRSVRIARSSVGKDFNDGLIIE